MGLFQTSIEPRCAYCAKGRELGPDQILCPKRGVMSGGSHCRAFRYDPLKRVPPRAQRRGLQTVGKNTCKGISFIGVFPSGRNFSPENLSLRRPSPAVAPQTGEGRRRSGFPAICFSSLSFPTTI